MIKHASGKAGYAMADATILGGGDVIGGLTYSRGAIMTGYAITGDIHVIEYRGTKRRGSMA